MQLSNRVNAMQWANYGLWVNRSVYDNIRRFLQFQMTVNIVALTICATGAIAGFGTPLTAVQLIWVKCNLAR